MQLRITRCQCGLFQSPRFHLCMQKIATPRTFPEPRADFGTIISPSVLSVSRVSVFSIFKHTKALCIKGCSSKYHNFLFSMLVIREAACKDAPRQAMESSILGLKSSTSSQRGRPSFRSHSILPVTAVLKGRLGAGGGGGGGAGSCGKVYDPPQEV